MLNELSRNIRFDNASKGFDPTEGGVARYIVLAISELCEAQNELRDGRKIDEIYYNYIQDGNATRKIDKPEGFSVEVADAIIRLLDIAGKFELDVEGDANYVPDYSGPDYTIDDWLLGAINTISMMHSYDPTEADFHDYLKESLGTLFLLCEKHSIMIMDVIQLKLAYNRTRPPKHGRKF